MAHFNGSTNLERLAVSAEFTLSHGAQVGPLDVGDVTGQVHISKVLPVDICTGGHACGTAK